MRVGCNFDLYEFVRKVLRSDFWTENNILGVTRHLSGAFSTGGHPARHGHMLVDEYQSGPLHWAALEAVTD